MHCQGLHSSKAVILNFGGTFEHLLEVIIPRFEALRQILDALAELCHTVLFLSKQTFESKHLGKPCWSKIISSAKRNRIHRRFCLMIWSHDPTIEGLACVLLANLPEGACKDGLKTLSEKGTRLAEPGCGGL